MKDIVLAAGGPSASADALFRWPNAPSRIFRTNYFFLNDIDPWNHRVTDWFVCQHDPADFRCCRAFVAGSRRFHAAEPITFWVPGLSDRSFTPREVGERLGHATVNVQRLSATLPAACRWDQDLAPERPTMGSFALAVAVGLQPETIYLAGIDLFQHASGATHFTSKTETREWQSTFNEEYLANRHRNHTLRGDIKYIEAALRAYNGKLVVCGTVFSNTFRARFEDRKEWEWHDG